MRSRQEIKRQVEGLEYSKKITPEYDMLGENNHGAIDAQIDVLQGGSSSDHKGDGYIVAKAEQAEEWLIGNTNEDLFSE